MRESKIRTAFLAAIVSISVLSAAIPLARAADMAPGRADLLSLARGAMPVALGGEATALRVGFDQALLAIDGDDGGFGATPRPGGPDTRIDFVYSLPAETTFEEFGVPNVLETPSPAQTFFRRIEVAGSVARVEGPFDLLGEATLATHAERGEMTRIAAIVKKPVRWIRVRLEGGIDVRAEKTFFEFSEIRGYGAQAAVPLSEGFHGQWKGRGVSLELKQEGARVTGCYDGDGRLRGTVSGSVLHALGESTRTGVGSAFVLALGERGEIGGVRSTNGAPFRLYGGEPVESTPTACNVQAVEPLGCGAIVHGLHFDYDSATLRPESEPILAALQEGLTQSSEERVLVVGHTSSEGSDAYNLDLSKRRARAVVDALVARGLERTRLEADGRGETQPIADERTDAGRSLNRRVEIECRGAEG
ncbi:MAG: OmpA family protein [Myxococcota bacterium]